jgi:nucleotidyltransferase substrate binding protein (TIGR01987 family)
MTKLEALKNQYQKAVKRLDEILKEEKSDIVRDSAIKRFEFTFDLSWKLLKTYLEEEKGVFLANLQKNALERHLGKD